MVVCESHSRIHFFPILLTPANLSGDLSGSRTKKCLDDAESWSHSSITPFPFPDLWLVFKCTLVMLGTCMVP